MIAKAIMPSPVVTDAAIIKAVSSTSVLPLYPTPYKPTAEARALFDQIQNGDLSLEEIAALTDAALSQSRS